MAGPKIIFDADECQCLLDMMDRLEVNCAAGPTIDEVAESDEERAALAKLREAGKF